MATNFCPQCETLVNEAAECCPKCGVPVISEFLDHPKSALHENRLFSVIAVAAMLLFIGVVGLLRGDDDSNERLRSTDDADISVRQTSTASDAALVVPTYDQRKPRQ